jgi:ADP-ribose pyrophosphatase YjhB (NUDIX family)
LISLVVVSIAMKQLQRYAQAFLKLLLKRPILGTTIIPILPDGRIVLVRRRDDGRWSLPGGILDWGEDVMTTAQRELTEETGLQLQTVKRLVGVYSTPDRDPRFHSVSVAIAVEANGSFHVHDVAEISEVKAFNPTDLPSEPLSHDHSRQLQDYLSGQTGLA